MYSLAGVALPVSSPSSAQRSTRPVAVELDRMPSPKVMPNKPTGNTIGSPKGDDAPTTPSSIATRKRPRSCAKSTRPVGTSDKVCSAYPYSSTGVPAG